ncbi:hypothetical protein CKO31_20185 [Thiohalocapsa halophila]|uniref:Uncharacterized protein n=1 Tax=Thiohalocapsa halophila TaxID=69359 RepID=A0ABS1CMF8_9GAMM|nr:hypothetical protein [Thiohalocapsa halophila]
MSRPLGAGGADAPAGAGRPLATAARGVRGYLRLFLGMLALLLAYTLLERELRAHVVSPPAVLDIAGITLTLTSLPWSLAALGFFRALSSPLAQVLRDLGYLLVFTGGTSLNVVLLTAGARWIMRRWRGG